jgi:hypothetical protein
MQAQLFDLYRSGMKTAADLAKTSLENTVRLQQKQLDIVRNILEESARSGDRLGEARSIEEVVGLQSQLAGTQFQRMAELWTSAWQLAAENQKAVMDQWQSQLGETTRNAEDVARVAAAQISRSAQPERKGQETHRKSA